MPGSFSDAHWIQFTFLNQLFYMRLDSIPVGARCFLDLTYGDPALLAG